MTKKQALIGAVVLALLSLGCGREARLTLARAGQPLLLDRPALYPETLAYDSAHQRFLVGSFRHGAIYAVTDAGHVTPLVDDPRLCSVLGIAIDAERGRLWAVNSDLGSSVKPSTPGPKHLAGVATYELTTGKPLRYVDLAADPPTEHLLNGIALDTSGNAYVTDSFAPVIYKVDADGNASVFVRDTAFEGPGINLNGLVVHPDGFLLVVKKSDGSLFKVPLAAPAQLSRVQLSQPLVGADGVLLMGRTQLLVVANKTPTATSNQSLVLDSSDGFKTATVRQKLELGDVYPTTAALRDGHVYVVHSRLNELIQAPAAQKSAFQQRATIEQIGSMVP